MRNNILHKYLEVSLQKNFVFLGALSGMFGISIITKTGILLFTHGLTNESTEDVDEELHAGLLSAIFNALRETQRESIKSIRQRDDYVYLLYEGVLTYGVLPAFEEDNRLYDFLRDIILKFELMYIKHLHKDTIIDRSRFDEFHTIVTKMYSDLVKPHTRALKKNVNIMQKSRFENFIIYEVEYFYQVCKSIKDPILNLQADRLTSILRNLMDFSNKIEKEILTCEFKFEGVDLIVFKTQSHCIAIFITPEDIEKGLMKKDYFQIRKKLV